jgi:hypothetical protein
MLQLTQSVKTPVSNETGIFNRKWRMIRFVFAKRSFESQLEAILTAAAGHESNSLPAGDYQYEVLCAEADSLCTEFADRWGLDLDVLRARVPGLSKLEGLSTPRATINYARLASFGLVAIPVLLFLMGVAAGLVNVGFHMIGGR